jgi:hypothetical protein
LIDDSQPPRRQQLHCCQFDAARQGERFMQQRPSPLCLTTQAEDRAEHSGSNGPAVQRRFGGSDDLTTERNRRSQSSDCRNTAVRQARQSWAMGSSALVAQKLNASS